MPPEQIPQLASSRSIEIRSEICCRKLALTSLGYPKPWKHISHLKKESLTFSQIILFIFVPWMCLTNTCKRPMLAPLPNLNLPRMFFFFSAEGNYSAFIWSNNFRGRCSSTRRKPEGADSETSDLWNLAGSGACHSTNIFIRTSSAIRKYYISYITLPACLAMLFENTLIVIVLNLDENLAISLFHLRNTLLGLICFLIVFSKRVIMAPQYTLSYLLIPFFGGRGGVES